MIRHCALFRFRSDTNEEHIEELLRGFVGLKDEIEGMVDVMVGVNVSPEGVSQGFDHGIIIDFPDAATRDAYLAHPAHLAHAVAVIARLDGGLDGAIAFDVER